MKESKYILSWKGAGCGFSPARNGLFRVGEGYGGRTQKSLFKVIRVSILGILFAAVPYVSIALCADSGTDAEVVWAQSDGQRFELYKAAHHKDGWGLPEKLTDDNADNVHPCLDTGPDGRKWLVWTAIEQGGYEIRYTFTDGDNGWHEPMRFPSPLTSNIAPALIVDDDNVPWLVWSGNDGRHNDEIYFSRYKDGKWQKPALVNKANDVPDILPMIHRNSRNGIEVTWQGFRGGRYVELISRWNGRHWGPERMLQEDGDAAGLAKSRSREKMSNEKEVELPDFVPDNRQFFLRVYEGRHAVKGKK